jgi:hypothetical protein
MRADLLLALFSATLEPLAEGKGLNAKPSAFSGLLDQLVESADPAASCPLGTLPDTHADPGSASCRLAASPACPHTGAAKESATANSQSGSGQASEIKAAATSAAPARTKTKAAPANLQPAAGERSRPDPLAALSVPVPDLATASAARRHLTTSGGQADNQPLTRPEGTADQAGESSQAGNLPSATAGPEVYGVDQAANRLADSLGQAGQTSHVSQAGRARQAAEEMLATAPQMPSGGNPSFADSLAQVGAPVPDTGNKVRNDAAATAATPFAPAPQTPRREAEPALTTPNQVTAGPLAPETPIGRNVQADRQSAAVRTSADAAPPAAFAAASSASANPRTGSSSGVPPSPRDAVASPVDTSPASSSPASGLAFSARLTPLSADANGNGSAGYQAQAAGTAAVKGRGTGAQRPAALRATAPATASDRDEANDSMPAFASRTASADPDADASPGDGPSQVPPSAPKSPLAAGGGNPETDPLAAVTPAAAVSAATLSESEDPSAANTPRQHAAAANQPAAQTGRGDTSPALTEHSQRPVTNSADTPENPAAQTATSWSAAAPGRTAEETPAARPAESLPQPPPAVEQPSVGQPKPSSAAQGIQIQMNAGDSRVEVRVTDRGGEVRVDVHTPDSRLAGALRADLPELAARIEQTGYRAETWQPLSPSSPDRWRVAELGAASPDTEDRSPRQGEQKQDEGRRQNSQQEDPPAQRKQDRKDFQWLFNSIR